MSLSPYSRCISLVLLSAGLLTAQTSYILETSPAGDIGAVSARYGLTVTQTLATGQNPVYLVTAPGPSTQPLIQQVQSDPSVLHFEADVPVEAPETQPGAVFKKGKLDPLSPSALLPAQISYFGDMVRASYVSQTATTLIQLSGAQASFGTGTGIVAVIDTGVDPNHPALVHSLVPGYDFTRNLPGTPSELADLSPTAANAFGQSPVAPTARSVPIVLDQSTVALLDQSTVALLDGENLPSDFGHGTMVAGLIHLVAPTAMIMPLKAFRADGSSQLSNIISAIYYAADHGARVINMSFNLTASSPDLKQAIAYATGKGVICVASVGNMGREVMDYPAGYPRVIGVGSTNASDQRSSFSNYGASSVRMAAPGEAIVAPFPGGNYAAAWGTSFATALVSGTVAMMAGVNPKVPYSSTSDALEHGVQINQDVGDARLDTYLSMQYYCYSH